MKRINTHIKTIWIIPVLFIALSLFAEEPLSKPVMVSVKGGNFFMGSNEGSFRTTERVHEVTLRPFFISETPVTQELYTAVMSKNPSAFKKGADFPVESVSWFDAVLFCNALSVRTGLSPAYAIEGEKVTWNRESKGFRLPTEAEWEFAARGGLYGAQGGPLEKAFFAGGNAENSAAQDYCWYSQNSAKTTHPVKSKLPNQLGLYDMSGNVWEWCWDWHDDYPAGPVTDYAGAATGRKRIYRGGSWYNNLNLLRTTFRISEDPSFKANSLGFRIAQNG
ncbi:MAG: formylglycine-generating enzyme family protein [Spirochaetaceae bacterium]|jgi:formylglycine-generating enzyme required for sulfatase activity|nr:formylglycine-generating enzyme family protein [Spirochaetaceae bacterium]